MLRGVWSRVVAQAASARAARTQFENGFGDALITYEQDVLRDKRRDRLKGDKDEQLDYLVYTEPIPAGTSVLTESIKGAFERYEITPGAIRAGGLAIPPSSCRAEVFLPGPQVPAHLND